ncbi:sulfite exporter TauE/SafE family protein [Alkalimarinus coralli]|uniref:sulfite exporter TauE/SafE family protein n=1 Tax=Alkalimarinus coralli TaxID=2935863 RepID=UPI00202B70EC|nr:sulfite exporter TauE/SafE family protein [Alkalimarinus coralli]
MVVLLYLVLGAIAGLLAGLFGIGGGLIIVPVLVFSFAYQGISPDVLTHMAVGTSLATIVFTSLSSVKTHHEKGGVRWELFKPMTVGIVLGAALGVYTAAELSGPVLQKVIGVFAIVMAAQMGFGLKPKPAREVPGNKGLMGVGAGIGWASAIFGIGGGSLSVPFLTWCNVRMQQAVGTSAACGLPIAVSAAVTNIYKGWGEPALPEWSAGFIYLPAFIGIVMTSVYFARVGAKLAHKLSAEKLKRIFALLLVFVGLRFLLA